MKYKNIFAIGDIHGCAQELELLLKKLPLSKETLVIFLGDYIDRGPYSKQVVDIILELKKRVPVLGLKGNHEKMFLEFLDNKTTQDAAAFIFNGGGATLASYADDFGNYTLPEMHLKFFKALLPYFETEDYIFVHAGLPDISLTELSKLKTHEDLFWVREEFFNSTFKWEKMIIHGHTPNRQIESNDKRINIDTSCVYGGQLTALQLPEKIVYQVAKQNEIEHRYLKEKDSQRRTMRYVGDIPVCLYKEGKPHHFRTINYSELGMLIYDILSEEAIFNPNDKIRGDIIIQNDDIIPFSASIVRCEVKSTGVFYALQFLDPPCGFYQK